MLIFTGFLVCLFLWSTLFSFLLGHEQAFGDGTKLSVKSLLESVDRIRRVSNWVWCVSNVESRKAETLGSAQSRQCHEESLSLKKNLLSHAQAFTVIPAVTGVTCNTVWSHSFVTLTTRTFDVWPRVLFYFSGHYQEKTDKYKGFLLMNFFCKSSMGCDPYQIQSRWVLAQYSVLIHSTCHHPSIWGWLQITLRNHSPNCNQNHIYARIFDAAGHAILVDFRSVLSIIGGLSKFVFCILKRRKKLKAARNATALRHTGSTVNKRHTMLTFFQIHNPQASAIMTFQNISPIQLSRIL